MLVLSRRIGEQLLFDDQITLTVLDVKGSQVRLGIVAPADVAILRGELREQYERPVIETKRLKVFTNRCRPSQLVSAS